VKMIQLTENEPILIDYVYYRTPESKDHREILVKFSLREKKLRVLWLPLEYRETEIKQEDKVLS